MELYSFFNSSTSYRVRIALALKGLEYDYHGVNLRNGSQSSDLFKEINPSKGVPVFITDDGVKITQSLAIIQMLDELYGEPELIPSDLELKMRVLEFSYAIASDIHPLNNVRVLNYLTQNLKVTDEQKKDWYNHWIKEGFDAAEAFLKRYRSEKDIYCFGDQITLADCCLVPQYANALRMNCNLEQYPILSEIYTKCIALPDFKRAAPSSQPDYTNN